MKDGEINDGLKELINRAAMNGAAPRDALHELYEGEGYKKSREIVKEYIESLPDIQINNKYVVMKPLKEVDPEKETPVQILSIVDPDQLSVLIKLANFRSGKSGMVKITNGSACQDIGIYAYKEAEKENPKAILGFFDIYARNNLKGKLGDDKLSLTIPMKLFMEMEKDADMSLMSRSTWRKLSSNS